VSIATSVTAPHQFQHYSLPPQDRYGDDAQWQQCYSTTSPVVIDNMSKVIAPSQPACYITSGVCVRTQRRALNAGLQSAEHWLTLDNTGRAQFQLLTRQMRDAMGAMCANPLLTCTLVKDPGEALERYLLPVNDGDAWAEICHWMACGTRGYILLS